MNKAQIEKAFICLNERLKAVGSMGEIGVVGGAAMVLAFNMREATKDVDAVFEPSGKIRKAAAAVAQELDLPPDWLNDAVKGFLPGEPETRHNVLSLSNLRVWVPPPQYLLAMKAISARLDSQDAADLAFLCRMLKKQKPDEVFEIVQHYYPREHIPAKTQFFIEELFEREMSAQVRTAKSRASRR